MVEPVPELEELYDAPTLAALDRPARVTDREPWRTPTRRAGLAGPMLMTAVLAARDVFDPAPDVDPVVEFRPGAGDADRQWVTFIHVPGAPKASRLIVRPWLAPAGSLAS